MAETLLQELKRYVDFGPEDEAALRELRPLVLPHARAIAEEFYGRAQRHAEAQRVFSGPDQVERLKRTLVEWMGALFAGPWDDEYLERRARIGRVHVQHDLPQRYMVAAMNVMRGALASLVERHHAASPETRARSLAAVGKVLDIELAIMLETYREATLAKVSTSAVSLDVAAQSRAPIFAAGADDALLVWNAGCEALTGIPRSAALGHSWDRLLGFSPAGAGAMRAARDAARAPQAVAPVTAQVSSPGGLPRIVRWQVATLGDAGERGFCAVGVDLTDERRAAERTRLLERVSALGTMAAGLAHEIRNPLNAAHLQLALAGRHLSHLPEGQVAAAREGMSIAGRELRRLAATVDAFLRFAKPQPLVLSWSDLRATVESAVAEVEPAITGSGVALSVAPGDPVQAEIDVERMSRVVVNLVHNAAEATGPGGSVRVAVDHTSGGAVLEVADDGPGLPPDARLFEPFFTTKENGAGLGLAVVHRIVLDHGGRIEVDRRAGWTVFGIVLPQS